MAYPTVRAYMDGRWPRPAGRGYTETLFGRRRLIPELRRVDLLRSALAGERQAMNAGIQGLAADIFKVALVRLDRAGWRTRPELEAKLVLQVHDEVILDVPPEEERAAAALAVTGGHDRGGRLAGPANGQPVLGGQLGRCQRLGLAGRPAQASYRSAIGIVDPWQRCPDAADEQPNQTRAPANVCGQVHGDPTRADGVPAGDSAADIQAIHDRAGSPLHVALRVRERPQLVSLYNKAAASQWNSVTDLDWATDVDAEHVLDDEAPALRLARLAATLPGSPMAHFGEKKLCNWGSSCSRRS